MSFALFAIVFVVLAVLYTIFLDFRARAQQNTPSAIIKRFEDAQIAHCVFEGEVSDIRIFGVNPIDLDQIKCLLGAWITIKNLMFIKGWDVSKLDKRLFSFYLVPEETKSASGVPSLVKAIDCSHNGAYGNGFCSPDNKLLTVNDKFQYDPNGNVVNKDVQIITIAGRGLPETFGTDDQKLVVVIPNDLSKPENIELIRQGAYNELEHLANYLFEQGTFEANCAPCHQHPIYQ